MELHLHLSVAFRALDKKWGKPVDLDSPEELYGLPCLPAIIERPTTTFSSEEFLRSRRVRPKPYSRYQEHRSKVNIKTNGPFADTSSSKIALSKIDATSMDSGLGQESAIVTRLVEDMTKEGASQAGSCESLDSLLERRSDNVLKQWKNTAKYFIQKCGRKVRS